MISINGRVYKGNNVSINGDVILIDGKPAEGLEDAKTITVRVEGDIESLSIDNCDEINVNGNVEQVSSKSGNIIVKGSVSGDILNKNGNIICGSVGGDVSNKNGSIIHN